MSQTKAQLIQPIGVVTASTIQVSGVVTATTLIGDVTGTVTGLSTTTANLDVGIVTTSSMVGDVTGSASSIFSGNNIVAGVVTATKFTGNTSGRSAGLADGTNANVGIFTATSFIGNLTGNAASLSNTDSQLNLGIVTATSFAGNFTGIGSGLTGTPNVVAGVVTSTFVGNFTGIGSGLSGTPNVRAGVVTASSFVGDFTGIGSGLTGTPNVTAGVVTASSFLGNFTGHASGLSGTPNVTAGLVTASSLLGNFTGFASGITGTPNITAGVITATAFAGNFTGIGSGLTGTPDYTAGIVTASSFIGNFTGIGSGLTGTPSFTAGIVTASSFLGNFTGVASGITGTPNITVAIMTATSYNGDGSQLTGVASTAFITNNVTANSSNTTINLNHGSNVILTQTSNTTIAFSNVETTEVILIQRFNGSGTITWPASIDWDGGSAPTLNTSSAVSNEAQSFSLLTRDGGTTWYGWENVNNSGGNELYVWGNGENGYLATNTVNTQYSSPIQISGLWTKFHPGNRHMWGMKADGSLWGWGKNNGGNLGQNQAEAQLEAASSPVQVPGTTWSFVQSGTYRTAALKSDNTLWNWGWNNDGGLGQNESAPAAKSSPVQVPGTNWSKISTNGYNTLATKSDGTLWAWGANNRGQLGQQGSENADRSSPVQIPGTTWEHVNFCNDCIFATKTDNTAWVWGRNDYGQLGLNQSFDQANYKNSPMQIPGTNWPRTRNKFGVSPGMMAAIKTDGTLWSWGYNNRGQLGQNSSGTSTNRRSSPTQVGSNTNWDRLHLSAGDSVVASKTDGTLWAWGGNNDGQLGLNLPTNSHRSSPVQIPGTDWNLDEVYGNTPIGVHACFQD